MKSVSARTGDPVVTFMQLGEFFRHDKNASVEGLVEWAEREDVPLPVRPYVHSLSGNLRRAIVLMDQALAASKQGMHQEATTNATEAEDIVRAIPSELSVAFNGPMTFGALDLAESILYHARAAAADVRQEVIFQANRSESLR